MSTFKISAEEGEQIAFKALGKKHKVRMSNPDENKFQRFDIQADDMLIDVKTQNRAGETNNISFELFQYHESYIVTSANWMTYLKDAHPKGTWNVLLPGCLHESTGKYSNRATHFYIVTPSQNYLIPRDIMRKFVDEMIAARIDKLNDGVYISFGFSKATAANNHGRHSMQSCNLIFPMKLLSGFEHE
jgi:hypothetical protein